jgi:hypothetical protein
MNIRANVLDKTGHTSHEWDAAVPAEVEAARALFDSLTKKNYRAFVGGEGGRRLDRFDPSVGEMTFVPQLQGG